MNHLVLKQYKLAIADLRKAIDLDTEDHLAMHALAVALFENPDRVEGDIAAAERLAARACELTDYGYDDYVQTLRYIERPASTE